MPIPSLLQHPAYFALGGVILILLVMVFALNNQRRHNRRIRRRFRDLEGEEQRMFSFLHDLGQAIENEPSPTMLSRIIVDGIDKVVNARGGAIYFLGTGNSFLLPSYISEDCPPLIGIPVEVRKKAERDPRALESHIRLSRVAVDDGFMARDRQVGASGTWVTARVYVAVGISGAIQHLQGIGACDKVVAINLDPGCDMIKRADLSVIGESAAILHALIAAVETYRNGAKRDAA